jgi:transposase
MAPHLTKVELDFVQALVGKGVTPTQIHARLAARRGRKDTASPTLANLRKALKGETYKRGTVETRGAKQILTRVNVLALNRARLALIKKAAKEAEVSWTSIIRHARVPKVDPTTAAKAVQAEFPHLKWRSSREKPVLDKETKEQRVAVTKKWKRKYKNTFFTKDLDITIDNKKWAVPTVKGAPGRLKMLKVRGQIRTRAEGLSEGFTKPNSRKHRSNPGASVSICAGIVNNKIRLWQELPKTWNGEEAAKLYSGPILKTLQKHRGKKRSYTVLEDNDPTGYKSNKGKKAKEQAGIAPIEFPKYSPDLNPLDFTIWNEIERKMMASKIKRLETEAEYKKRLRRTAMSLSENYIKKAMASVWKRAQMVIDEEGGYIKID